MGPEGFYLLIVLGPCPAVVGIVTAILTFGLSGGRSEKKGGKPPRGSFSPVGPPLLFFRPKKRRPLGSISFCTSCAFLSLGCLSV